MIHSFNEILQMFKEASDSFNAGNIDYAIGLYEKGLERIKPLMENLQEVEPLESLNPMNEITGLLQDWTTNRQSARTIDDIFNKLPLTK